MKCMLKKREPNKCNKTHKVQGRGKSQYRENRIFIVLYHLGVWQLHDQKASFYFFALFKFVLFTS